MLNLSERFSCALQYAMFVFGFIVLENGVPFVIKELKTQQISVIWTFLNSYDVLCILPTGFGKSVMFQMLPFIYDFLVNGDMECPFNLLQPTHVCLVVSPLISLMTDQVSGLLKFGRFACWWDSVEEKLLPQAEGVSEPSLIYASPESFLRNKTLKNILNKIAIRVICIAVDEAHCVSDWGDGQFRPAYSEIGDMRAFYGCSVLAVTATATSHVQKHILNSLHFKSRQKIFMEIPLMPNLFFGVFPKSNFANHVQTILSDLKNMKALAPRRIIFCSNQLNVGYLFVYFQEQLQADQYVCVEDTNHRLFAMYHKDTPDMIKKSTLTKLALPDSPLRCIFATVAFGMGVDCVFREVLHLGCPRVLADYVQQAGRAGRDGLPASASLYCNGHDLRKAEDSMRNFCSEKKCKRKIVAEHFAGCQKILEIVVPKNCCSVCTENEM
eukprot:Pompholyxophrys_punicea_v1_NODE_643_length_1536_cov_17.109386.p1 type:complete len:440 gc:universal NODE_643_length_1536_cov_17.109386:157-1476(+)